LSVDDYQVSFSLEVNVEQALTDVRKLQTVLYRTLSLLQKFAGEGNVGDAIRKFQRLIMITNQLRLALIALNAASGPVGWALALVGVASFAVTTSEFMYDEFHGD